MIKYTFGFIGAGNMGSALASALSEKINAAEIAITDKDAEKASELARSIGAVYADTEEIMTSCKYVFIAIKPQTLPEFFDEVREILEKREDRLVLVTMAAGTSIEKLLSLAGKELPVIRIMPNTPVRVGKGMILYTANDAVEDSEREFFVSSLEKAGTLYPISENSLDSDSIITGCGPAYSFMFIDAMAKAAEALGTPASAARLFAIQTVLGAAELALSSDRSLTELRDAVCSKGGTTIEGVKVLEKNALADTVESAARASYARTLELLNGK